MERFRFSASPQYSARVAIPMPFRSEPQARPVRREFRPDHFGVPKGDPGHQAPPRMEEKELRPSHFSEEIGQECPAQIESG